MKIIATLLIAGFLLHISPTKPMEKPSKDFQVVPARGGRSRKDARPREIREQDPQEKMSAGVDAIRNARPQERTAIRARSIPEVDRLIQITLSMQKQTSAIEEQQKSANTQLVELAKTCAAQNELLQTQQGQLRAQDAQIAKLIALFKTANASLLPSDLLDDSSSGQSSPTVISTLEENPTKNVSSAVALASVHSVHSRLRSWTGNLDSPSERDGQIIDAALEEEPTWSPNRPRMSKKELAHNPWESPNHPKK